MGAFFALFLTTPAHRNAKFAVTVVRTNEGALTAGIAVHTKNIVVAKFAGIAGFA